MKLFFPLCLFWFCCGSAMSDDMTLNSGRVLKDATVSDNGEDFIRVHHSEGIAKVPYSELSEELQKKYNMTKEEVTARYEDKKRVEEEQKARQEELNKSLRDSLSESEKLPRYIRGADMFKMMNLITEVTPVEAEYAALVWNSGEAQRVGMTEQVKIFMQQAALYEPRVKEARMRREKAGENGDKKREQLQGELASANKRISQLQNKISDMQGNMAQMKRDNSSPNTVFVETPVYVQPPRPPIIITSPICRPSHYPSGITYPSGAVTPIRPIRAMGGSMPAEAIRPAVVRPAGSSSARR